MLLRSIAFLSTLAFAPLAAAADQQYDIHEKTLENGLRVVTLEDHSCPIVAVQVWYHVGSKDEDPARTGFAHMFEHMMFRGTDRLGPEDHFKYIRGSGGDCNAFTAFDNTTYVQVVPKDQLPMVLWLEAERMSALKVDEKGFHTERKVVEEERRLGLNQPYGSVLEKVLAQVFTQHPYKWSPIGSIEHLEAAKSEELLRFWEKYYVPNNAVLVVCGDVDHADVEKEAQKAFGWIPRCADPPRVTTQEPLPPKPLELEIEEARGPVPITAVAYRTVPQNDDDALALEMLMQVLGGGESSRIYKKIVDEDEKAPMAMAGAFSMEQAGFAAAGAVQMPFSDSKGIVEAIDEQFEKVKAEGVTEAELAKVKTSMLRRLVDESKTVESKANLLGTAALFHGGPQWLNGRSERIENVTIDDLKRVANTYFTPERRVVVKVKPTLGGMVRTLLGGIGGKKGDEAGQDGEHAHDHAHDAKDDDAKDDAAPALVRSGPKAEAKRPADYPTHAPVAPTRAVKMPVDAKTKTLDNGLEVVVIENHEVPIVSVRLGLLNGAFVEKRDRPGAASMACAMLTKGSGKHTAQQLAEELESKAISLNASADMDSSSVGGSSASGQLPRLMQLLAEVVTSPTFPAKEFEKAKKQALTGMAIAEKQPQQIAERTLSRLVWGEHFYGRPASGLSDDVKKLKLEDAIAWWKSAARPDQAVLYFAGDVKAEDAFDLADALFGTWTATGDAPKAEVKAPPELPKTSITLVDVPGAIQSQIRVAHRGITRGDPRYTVGRVLTGVFGGAFNARLNEVIRVKKGLTYGASGGLRSQRFGGTFYVSTFSKTRTTVDAVQAILDEVNRMRTEPPTAEELDQSRSYLVGSFAGDHETPESILGELWGLERDGLTKDFIDKYLDGVVKTTSEDVAKVANELIDPDHLVIVVVGDAAQVAEGLAKIAPLTVLDEDGKPKELKKATDGD